MLLFFRGRKHIKLKMNNLVKYIGLYLLVALFLSDCSDKSYSGIRNQDYSQFINSPRVLSTNKLHFSKNKFVFKRKNGNIFGKRKVRVFN